MWTWKWPKEEEHTKDRDDKNNDDATETMAGADNNTDHGTEEEEVEKIDNGNVGKAYVTNTEDVSNDNNGSKISNNNVVKERDNTGVQDLIMKYTRQHQERNKKGKTYFLFILISVTLTTLLVCFSHTVCFP